MVDDTKNVYIQIERSYFVDTPLIFVSDVIS